jgi:hypothetical protein
LEGALQLLDHALLAREVEAAHLDVDPPAVAHDAPTGPAPHSRQSPEEARHPHRVAFLAASGRAEPGEGQADEVTDETRGDSGGQFQDVRETTLARRRGSAGHRSPGNHAQVTTRVMPRNAYVNCA